MKIASLVLLACFITYANWGSEGLGKRCESIELNNIVAMGCGDYIENTWFGCSAPAQGWWCNQEEVMFQGSVCTGSEPCPWSSCSGPTESYCSAGWYHSGLMCTEMVVSPCCFLTEQCTTIPYVSPIGWPGFECGCGTAAGAGTAAGTRLVAAYGATCTGSGSGS